MPPERILCMKKKKTSFLLKSWLLSAALLAAALILFVSAQSGGSQNLREASAGITVICGLIFIPCTLLLILDRAGGGQRVVAAGASDGAPRAFASDALPFLLPGKDLIRQPFRCRRQIAYEWSHRTLFSLPGGMVPEGWELTNVDIDIRTGQLCLRNLRQKSFGPFLGGEDGFQRIGWPAMHALREDVLRQVRDEYHSIREDNWQERYPDHKSFAQAREQLLLRQSRLTRLAGMNQETWRSFIREQEERPAFESAYGKAPAAIPAAPASAYPPDDMDGWYISLQLRFGQHLHYLRRLDSGWRLFSASTADPNSPLLYLQFRDCSEENLLAILEGKKFIGQANVFDRLLSTDEYAYLRRLMPKSHPDQRPDGALRTRVDVSIYGAWLEAGYIKNSRLIPAADLPCAAKLESEIDAIARSVGLAQSDA